jgi:hypothetical protein
MAKKYRVKGSTRRKLMQIEMSKELRMKSKKTKPVREITEEHEAFKQFDQRGEAE